MPSWSAAPAHGSLTLNADGSFTYTPAANYNGPDSFTYKANDGQADSNVATVSINVGAVNDAPVAQNDTAAATEDTPVAGNVLTNDTDVDGDALSAVLVSGPAHGSLTLNADGSFTYTPAANYNGPDSFTYKANDGQADSNVATVSITVGAVNDAPVANADSIAATEDTPVCRQRPDQRHRRRRRCPECRPGQRPRPWQPDAQRRRQLHLHAGRQLQRPGQLHLQGQRRPGRQQRRHRLDQRRRRQRRPGGAERHGGGHRGHAGSPATC